MQKISNILISIINHNSHDDTLRVIRFIESKLEVDGVGIDFFITDNSTDKSKNKQLYLELNKSRRFQFISTTNELKAGESIYYDSQNIGFGGANNIVIDYLRSFKKYDVLWMLNSDLELSVNTLREAIKALSLDDCGIAGSVVFEIDSRDGAHKAIYGTVNMSSFRGYASVPPVSDSKKIIEVDAVLGTSMFIKRKVFEELKFDEEFFMYVEENDYCFRAKKLGFKSLTVIHSTINHESGKTFGKAQYLRWSYKVRNLLYFKKKNGTRLNLILILYLLVFLVNLVVVKKLDIERIKGGKILEKK
jgi:GT2 family glycosyltransferase